MPNINIRDLPNLIHQIYPARQSSLLRQDDEFEFFPEEYFNSSNISIYFENIFIDEITRLSFSLQEQLMPIYGYNDYVPKMYARGSRLIQGQFGINFKEAYYLRRVISEASANRNRGGLLQNDRQTLEQLETARFLTTQLKALGSKKLSAEEREKEITRIKNISSEAFELVATAYELALWGVSDITSVSVPGFQQTDISDAKRLLSGMLKGLDLGTNELGILPIIKGIQDAKTKPYFKQAIPGHIDGLFITIEYGEVKRFTRTTGPQKFDAVLVDNDGNPILDANGKPQTVPVTDIENIKGRSLDQIEYVPGTVKTLSNVQITGVTQNVDMSGSPIEEVYNFICSDADVSPK